MARCNGCTREETVRLVDGRKVCNYCEDWRNECEARHLLRYPLSQRQDMLEERLKKRGEVHANKLKEAMTLCWAKGRK